MAGCKKTLGIGCVAVVFASCVTARVDVFDRKTALENQILGTFDELSKDMQLVASVRGTDQEDKAVAMSETRRRAVAAMQNQEFNRDDIDELKAKGIIGENNKGLLSLIEPALAGLDQKTLALAKRLVQEENRDRKTVVESVVTLSEELTEKDLPEVWRTYRRMRLESARPGDLVQDDQGNWIRKGENE